MMYLIEKLRDPRPLDARLMAAVGGWQVDPSVHLSFISFTEKNSKYISGSFEKIISEANLTGISRQRAALQLFPWVVSIPNLIVRGQTVRRGTRQDKYLRRNGIHFVFCATSDQGPAGALVFPAHS